MWSASPVSSRGALEGRLPDHRRDETGRCRSHCRSGTADKLSDDNIMPEALFDPQVAEVVANAVKSHIR